MADLRDVFGGLEKRHLEGVWHTYPDTDIRFRLRFAGGANRAYTILMAVRMRPHNLALERYRATGSDMTDAEAAAFMEDLQAVTQGCMAETCFADWQNVALDGEDLACTPENALRVLQSSALLRLWIEARCTAEDAYSEQAAYDLGEHVGN